MGVIAVIAGGLENGIEVECGDAEVSEVVEVFDDSEEVAALVAVGGGIAVPSLQPAGFREAVALGEAVGEDLIEDCVPHPFRRVDVAGLDAKDRSFGHACSSIKWVMSRRSLPCHFAPQ